MRDSGFLNDHCEIDADISALSALWPGLARSGWLPVFLVARARRRSQQLKVYPSKEKGAREKHTK
jgi:hypothetical protein